MEDERERGEAITAVADAERTAGMFPRMDRCICRVEAQCCISAPAEETDGLALRLPIDADSVPSCSEAGRPLPRVSQEQAHPDAGAEADAGPGSELSIWAVEGEDQQRQAVGASAGACDLAYALSGHGDSAGGVARQRTVFRTAAERVGLAAALEISAAAFPSDSWVGGELRQEGQGQGGAAAGDVPDKEAGRKHGIAKMEGGRKRNNTGEAIAQTYAEAHGPSLDGGRAHRMEEKCQVLGTIGGKA